MFSERTHWKLETNLLSKKMESLKKGGVRILDLTESNPTHAGIRYPKEILRSFNRRDNLNYEPDPRGLIRARKAVMRYYARKGICLNPPQVILTASTSEGYSHMFRLLANPGDEVLVSEPSYPLFNFLAGLCDVHLKTYPLSFETKWCIDFDEIEKRITPKTRSIMVVNPNNPTGNFVSREEISRLAEIAKRKNIALIADEVFLDYSIGAPGRSFAGNQQSLTFTLSGISKILGLPQMKLGWIVASGPSKLCDQALARLEVIADTFLSVSTPVQNALETWFAHRSAIQHQILNRVRANLKSIQLPSSCQLLDVEGGWYAVIRIPRTRSEEEWVIRFLEKDHVWVQPGYFFDFPKEAYIVVSLLTPERMFQQGMKRIAERIEHE